jgi:hypothetical protein
MVVIQFHVFVLRIIEGLRKDLLIKDFRFLKAFAINIVDGLGELYRGFAIDLVVDGLLEPAKGIDIGLHQDLLLRIDAVEVFPEYFAGETIVNGSGTIMIFRERFHYVTEDLFIFRGVAMRRFG